MTPAVFRKKVWDFYKKEGRHDLPWRFTRTRKGAGKQLDPYKILVSEIMLQQTQVDRVIPKYRAFLTRFPNVRMLAEAPLADVLGLWSGLGYNRRAVYLKRAAEYVVNERSGKFPKTAEEMQLLPGVGPYTARAVAIFAYNQAYTCIETNIRSVFIHAFFPNTKAVHDTAILPYIEKTLDKTNPREWYWALMDYGAHLKRSGINPSRKSAHHVRQKPFAGSLRQVRGMLLKKLLKNPLREKSISKIDERADLALAGLVKDGLALVGKDGYIYLAK
jgi:A/G-specific adenine glycosylase